MTDIVERLRDGGETCGIQRCTTREAKGCTCAEAANVIERLRESLRDCHHVLHKLMAIVPGNDMAVDEMTKVMAKARAALWEDWK